MKTISSLFLLFGLVSSGIAVASAGGWYNRYWGHSAEQQIHHLLEQQHHKIERGIASGRLTPKEARKLMRKHAKIVRLEDRFASDGWLSPGEIRILRHKIHRLDDKIIAKSHNRRRWFPGHERWHDDHYRSYHPHTYYPAYPIYRPYREFQIGGLSGRIYLDR